MSYVVDKIKKAIDKILDVIKGIWNATVSFAEFMLTLDFDALEAGIKTLFRDVVAPVFKPIFGIIGIKDETIYSVEVVTIPLLDAEAKYIKNSIFSAIKQNQDLSEELRYAIHTSQRSTLRSYLNYAKKHYPNGVPTVAVSEYFTDTEVVKDILETIEGEGVTIHTVDFSDPNWDLWSKDYLLDNNSYDFENNTLDNGGVDWYYSHTSLNGLGDAFLIHIYRNTSINVVVRDYTQVLLDPTEFTDTWTRTITTTTYTPTDTPLVQTVDTNYVRTPTSTGGPYQTTYVTISDNTNPGTENAVLTEIDRYNEGGYYAALYEVDSAPDDLRIWFYEVALGTYPELNNSLVGGVNDATKTLPIVSLREEYVNINSDPNSELYKSTKKLFNILNLIDVDDLIEQVNANPDIHLIQDAFVLFGVNLYTQDQASLRYLFNFFMALGVLPKYDKAAFNALTELDKSNANFVFTITEGRYNAAISGNYIEITEIAGYIGKVGYVETSFTILPNTTAVVENVGERTDPVEQDNTNSVGLINSVFYIRAQLSEDTYTEIEVSGLLLTTYILTKGTDVGIKVTELVDPVTGDAGAKANFIVPLSFYVLEKTNPIECEQVIYDAFHLVVYAEEVTELEYYQTPAFFNLVSIVIKVVAVIVFVLSAGTINLNTLWLFIEQVLIQYGLSAALKEVLRHGLSDVEKVIAAALFIFAGGKAAGILSPDTLLTLSDKLLLAVNSITTFVETDTELRSQELLEEQREFESLLTTKNEEIQLAEDYLTSDGTIDTFNLLNSRVMPILDTQLTPQQFYDRSLLINVAPIVLGQASTFVASALDLNTLPTFPDNTTNTNNLLIELT